MGKTILESIRDNLYMLNMLDKTTAVIRREHMSESKDDEKVRGKDLANKEWQRWNPIKIELSKLEPIEMKNAHHWVRNFSFLNEDIIILNVDSGELVVTVDQNDNLRDFIKIKDKEEDNPVYEHITDYAKDGVIRSATIDFDDSHYDIIMQHRKW